MAKVMPIPKGFHTITPNLTIRDCSRAIDFYKRALGAEELMRMPTADGRSVMHAELKLGDSILFMNDEMPGAPAHAPATDHLSPADLWLYVGDCDAAYDRAVKAGAKGTQAPTDMFWGDRTCTVADPFGYVWHFATHVKDMSEAEMKKAGEEFQKQMAVKH
jgi:uncharacterized glyoxalase superfamily protein PhnB